MLIFFVVFTTILTSGTLLHLFHLLRFKKHAVKEIAVVEESYYLKSSIIHILRLKDEPSRKGFVSYGFVVGYPLTKGAHVDVLVDPERLEDLPVKKKAMINVIDLRFWPMIMRFRPVAGVLNTFQGFWYMAILGLVHSLMFGFFTYYFMRVTQPH